MNLFTRKGFTLVEILIVVVIIALLAIMAVPAFKKVNESTHESAMITDARYLGAAVQEYIHSNDVTSVAHGYDPADGRITGELQSQLESIGSGYDIQPAELTATTPFTMSTPRLRGGAPYTFDADGNLLEKPTADE